MVSMIMAGVFDLGEHFSVTDCYKIDWEYIHRSMELQNAILEQGRVSKSNFRIARASRILILEMVCNVLKELERSDLISVLSGLESRK